MGDDFKRYNSFESRFNEVQTIMFKYPKCVPVFCEKNKSCNDIKSLTKKKYILPFNLTVGEFLIYIRKSIYLNKDQGIYLLIDGNIPRISDNFFNLYHNYKDNDGFLYLVYSSESTFG